MIGPLLALLSLLGIGSRAGENEKVRRLIARNPRGVEFCEKAEAAHAAGDEVSARYWARKAIGLKP